MALDPNHEIAAKRLAQLEESQGLEPSTETFEINPPGVDDALPSWMTEEEEELSLETANSTQLELEQADSPAWLDDVSQEIDESAIPTEEKQSKIQV